jgi:hypothetical protein
MKAKHAQLLGLTLIPIPFWWDRSATSLISTIQDYRPDLLPSIPHDGCLSIPLEMPSQYHYRFKQNKGAET